MKQYQRHRTVGELLKICKEQKVYIDTKQWARGGDTLCIGAPTDDPDRGWVVYNTFNGKFFGRTPSQKVVTVANPIRPSFEFDSSQHLEHFPWFQALLDFFYTDDPLPKNPPRASAVDLTLGGTRLLNKS